MDYLPHILTAFGVFLLAAMSPGPNALAIMGTSISTSRGAGVMTAMGVAAGDFLWSALSVTGLTLVISQFAEVGMILQVLGGGYLLYLGIRTLISAARGGEVALRPDRQSGHPWRHFYRGFLIIMSNPKSILFWLSVMSLVLKPGAPLWVAVTLVVGMTVMSIVWHGLLALLFSTGPVLRFYGRARRAIDALFGAFFCLIGGRILLSN